MTTVNPKAPLPNGRDRSGPDLAGFRIHYPDQLRTKSLSIVNRLAVKRPSWRTAETMLAGPNRFGEDAAVHCADNPAKCTD